MERAYGDNLGGFSQDLLAEAMHADPSASSSFWLDAHGIYDFAEEDPEVNPLAFKIETIVATRGPGATIIAVDDARGLGTKKGWPDRSEIVPALATHGFIVATLDDILIAASSSLRVFGSLF